MYSLHKSSLLIFATAGEGLVTVCTRFLTLLIWDLRVTQFMLSHAQQLILQICLSVHIKAMNT